MDKEPFFTLSVREDAVYIEMTAKILVPLDLVSDLKGTPEDKAREISNTMINHVGFDIRTAGRRELRDLLAALTQDEMAV